MKLKNILPVIAVAIHLNAFALYEIDGTKKGQHLIKVPSGDIAQIEVDGSKIKGVHFKSNELDIEQGATTGGGTTSFIARTKIKKRIGLIVETEAYSHELILDPQEGIPLERILIREGGNPAIERKNSRLSTAEGADPRDEAVIEVIAAMASKNNKSGKFSIQLSNTQVGLWREVDFRLVARYKSGDFVGESYIMRNKLPGPLRISEQELWRKDVVGVASDSLVLGPNQETNVYVVKQVRFKDN